MLRKFAVALVAASVFTVPAVAQTPAPNAPKASVSQSVAAPTSTTVVKADQAPIKHARHVRHLHGALLAKHVTRAAYAHHRAHVTHLKYVEVKHGKYAHQINHVKFAHNVKPAKTQKTNVAAPSGPAPASVTTGSATKSGVN